MFTLDMFFTSFRRISAILPPALRSRMRLLFLLMTLLSIAELASIIALTGFFSSMNAPERILSLSAVQTLLQVFPALAEIAADRSRFILWACMVPVGIIILKNILSAIVAWRSAMLGEEVAAHVGSGIMQRFLYMPYSWHLSAQSSQALTAMQWRFNLGQLLLQILTVYSNMFTVILLFCGLIMFEPGSTASAMLFMMIVSLLTYRLLRSRIDASGITAANAQQAENAATMTAIGGVRELLIYQQQPVFLQAIDRHVREGMKPRTFLGISSAIPSWSLESAGFFLIWLVTYLLIHFQNAPLPTITTTIFMLALTAWRVLPSLNKVVGSIVSIRALHSTAIPCLDYFSSLKQTPEPESDTAEEDFSIQSEIVFDHVSYRYPGAEQDALTDINCRIPVGTTLGLIGRSGAGKSTFINILSGLLEPTSGRLLVDGKPMTAAQLAAYRKQIGYVPQSPYLLSGTVAQNVAFCDWGKPIDTARVRQACQEAAIDFLGPDCSDIERSISANGSGLSGGQIQRVSIARALYTKPVLLIFDEATSALDQAAEAEVQQAMLQSKGKRTNIIAAHRLKTLLICDQVIWLQDGKIISKDSADIIIDEYEKNIENSK